MSCGLTAPGEWERCCSGCQSCAVVLAGAVRVSRSSDVHVDVYDQVGKQRGPPPAPGGLMCAMSIMESDLGNQKHHRNRRQWFGFGRKFNYETTAIGNLDLFTTLAFLHMKNMYFCVIRCCCCGLQVWWSVRQSWHLNITGLSQQ